MFRTSSRFIGVTDDSSKSNGCHITTTRSRKSSRRNIGLHSGQSGRFQKSQVRMSRYLDTSTKAQMAQIMVSMEDPVVPLERNLYGHPLAGLLWKRQFEKILLKHGWEKVPNRECLFVHREKGLFLSVYVDDIKLAGKKQNLHPMWKVLNKEVELGEPTSFLDHVYVGCVSNQQRYCGELHRYVRIQDFYWNQRKTTDQSFRET